MNAFTTTAFALLTFGIIGCSDAIRPKINTSVVTALPRDVQSCRSLGFIATDSSELDKKSGLDQLREKAVQLGGNTVFVTSYQESTTGTAYLCSPPINPDGRHAGPQE